VALKRDDKGFALQLSELDEEKSQRKMPNTEYSLANKQPLYEIAGGRFRSYSIEIGRAPSLHKASTTCD
jgi:hypothetical protein